MPEEFVKVAKAGQLPPGRMMLVELGRFERILLVNVNGSYHAVDELCPHSGAALSEGDLYGEVVECPAACSGSRQAKCSHPRPPRA